ncbi:MAG: hypothetical protein FWE35_09895 [Streptosporangiales bacterium]|nr:hypothetical protein [Streptosporangiales bacterium]
MSTLTAIVVFGTVFHVAVLAIMIWIRVRRTDSDPAAVAAAPVRACAVCGEPATTWSYDGLDPDEQVNSETGRAWSADTTHYRPVCEEHWRAAAHRA